MSSSPFICSVCKGSYTSQQYFKSHLRYPSNARCRLHYESDQPLTSSPKLPPGSKRKHLNLNHNPLCDPRITNAVKALDELSGQEEQESKKRTANVHDATNSGEKIPAVMDPNEMECESEIEEDDDRVDRTMMDDFKGGLL